MKGNLRESSIFKTKRTQLSSLGLKLHSRSEPPGFLLLSSVSTRLSIMPDMVNGNNQLDYENLRFIQSSILLFHELGLGKVNKRLGRNKMTFTSGLKQEI